jgi:hypothetical protein
MAKEPGTYCPLLQKNCIEHKCAWFIRVAGTNKNTGQPVDDTGCAIAWMPVLMIETANETRQAGAAIESLRNENVKGQDATRSALLNGMANMTLQIEGGDA